MAGLRGVRSTETLSVAEVRTREHRECQEQLKIVAEESRAFMESFLKETVVSPGKAAIP